MKLLVFKHYCVLLPIVNTNYYVSDNK